MALFKKKAADDSLESLPNFGKTIVGARVGAPWHEITKETAKEYAKRHPRHKWGKC